MASSTRISPIAIPQFLQQTRNTCWLDVSLVLLTSPSLLPFFSHFLHHFCGTNDESMRPIERKKRRRLISDVRHTTPSTTSRSTVLRMRVAKQVVSMCSQHAAAFYACPGGGSLQKGWWIYPVVREALRASDSLKPWFESINPQMRSFTEAWGWPVVDVVQPLKSTTLQQRLDASYRTLSDPPPFIVVSVYYSERGSGLPPPCFLTLRNHRFQSEALWVSSDKNHVVGISRRGDDWIGYDNTSRTVQQFESFQTICQSDQRFRCDHLSYVLLLKRITS